MRYQSKFGRHTKADDPTLHKGQRPQGPGKDNGAQVWLSIWNVTCSRNVTSAQETEHNGAEMLRKREGIQKDLQADCRTGGHEANSPVFRQAAESERLDIVEWSA
jgi:hypothetical protein